jgi:hypothetical protein
MNPEERQFSPSDFMRARRPELYSDSTTVEESELTQNEFEYLLESLTARNEQFIFEQFCRMLLRRVLCPNITTLTGPTGGGDRKVDSETYPISSEIEERLFEGTNPGSNERWAFAFSAKADWKSKARQDVKKAVETGRGYTKIFFVTNQFARDKTAAEEEDALAESLSRDHAIRVVIFDRSWLYENVQSRKLWELVFDCFPVVRPRVTAARVPGKYDAERQQCLKLLDDRIQNAEKYRHAKRQLAEDFRTSAILARGLGHPRHEIEGRLRRSQSIANGEKAWSTAIRAIYDSAWTAYWWFDDVKALESIYEELENLVSKSDDFFEVDYLINLFHCAIAWTLGKNSVLDRDDWLARSEQLRLLIQRHMEREGRPSTHYWAQTRLLFIELASDYENACANVVPKLEQCISEGSNLPDYPFEAASQLVQQLRPVLGHAAGFADLMEKIISLSVQRAAESKEGRLRLTSAVGELEQKQIYQAIAGVGKSKILLAKEEERDQLIKAFAVGSLAYESVGLLWAAYADIILAIDRSIREDHEHNTLSLRTISLFRRIVWLSLQLAEPVRSIKWIAIVNGVLNTREFDDDDHYVEFLADELRLMDKGLAQLIIQTSFEDLTSLTMLPSVLTAMGLNGSASALSFLLGDLNPTRELFGFTSDEDVQEFWSKLALAASDLSIPEWHNKDIRFFYIGIIGCKIKLKTNNDGPSLMLAESVLAFIESFFSTLIAFPGALASRSELQIEIKRTVLADTPMTVKVVEDECGESTILVMFPKLKPENIIRDSAYGQTLVTELMPRVIAELHPFENVITMLENLFSHERAPDRAVAAAQFPLALFNFQPDRNESISSVLSNESKDTPLTRSCGWTKDRIAMQDLDKDPFHHETEAHSGIDSIRHKDVSVTSVINVPLWDRAGWCGIALAKYHNDDVPIMSLLFRDGDSAEKIFRGWRKRFGKIDNRNELSINVVRGIDREHPHHYRVLIMPNLDLAYTSNKHRYVTSVFRTHEMNARSNTTLSTLLSDYKKAGKYYLNVGLMVDGNEVSNLEVDHIEKDELVVADAWSITPKSFLRFVLRGNDKPMIPPGTKAPPVVETLKMLREGRL